jgi:ribonuclease P protein component
MEDVKRILVLSSMTKSSRKAIHYGVSLSKKYVNSGANRTVIPEQIEHLFRSKSNSDSGMIANTF